MRQPVLIGGKAASNAKLVAGYMSLEDMGGRVRAFRMATVALSLIVIEVAAQLTSPLDEHWHYVLHRLYYLAIIGGGLSYGWVGGLATAAVSSLLYLMHTSDIDSPDARNALDRYLETLIFCLVGLLAGVLSDRERQQRRKAEQVGEELQRVYQELRNNLEHLKRASRLSALGHMSAGLAHEIRNPLASIEGSAAILSEESASECRRLEFLNIIQKECQRLNRLVTNFLEFARPRAPHKQSAEVGTLVQSVVEVVEQTAARHQISFVVEIPKNIPPVPCDAEQVKQVLLNLILNAVQAMPQGGEVRVTAKAREKLLTIRVLDNGPGVPPENLDSIYDPFFTTKETGTGLGLPTAYQIIEQHGGELKLERSSPSGSCFAFTLPLNGNGK